MQNSIRHNLSLHSKFVRVQNEGTGKSSWWTLDPECAQSGSSPSGHQGAGLSSAGGGGAKKAASSAGGPGGSAGSNGTAGTGGAHFRRRSNTFDSALKAQDRRRNLKSRRRGDSGICERRTLTLSLNYMLTSVCMAGNKVTFSNSAICRWQLYSKVDVQ